MQRVDIEHIDVRVQLEYWNKDGLVLASGFTTPVPLTSDLRRCANRLGLSLELTAFHSISDHVRHAFAPSRAGSTWLLVLPDPATLLM